MLSKNKSNIMSYANNNFNRAEYSSIMYLKTRVKAIENNLPL